MSIINIDRDFIAIIDNKYLCFQKIGKGASAKVYLAIAKSALDNKSKEEIKNNDNIFALKVIKNLNNNYDFFGDENSGFNNYENLFKNEMLVLAYLQNCIDELKKKAPNLINNNINIIKYHEGSSNSIFIKCKSKGINIKNYKTMLQNLNENSNNINYLNKIADKTYKIFILKLDYLENGSLFDYIYYPNKGLGENYARLIAKSLLDGIQFLHLKNICHRDIKTENIMLDKNFTPFLADFGFGSENNNNLKIFCGTPHYAAPELLMKCPYNGCYSDIFSFGVLLYVTITGIFPFKSSSIYDSIYTFICRGEYSKFWENVNVNLSNSFMKLFNSMVAYDPSLRPSISEILMSEWIIEGNYSNSNYLELKNEFINRKQIIEIRKKNNKH